MKTYIIRTKDGEFYCGKTNRMIHTRIEEHRKEKKPHWFAFKNRRYFSISYVFLGDFEKEIKRFGVRKFVELLNLNGVSLS